MRILLDTSAYSGFLRGNAKVRDILQVADAILLNPIVLGELKSGFLRGVKTRQNEALLEQFLGSPRVSVVPIEDETAVRYAAIRNSLWRSGTPVPTNDIWIGASAMQHGLTVVTTDRHFQHLPQILVEFVD